jgi:3-oxoacyl-(acyl-carrier-protein) synthase
MRNRVVVTGMGVVAPNAPHGLDNFEQALREGRSGIRFIPSLKELNFACQVGGIPQDFENVRKQYFNEERLLSINECIGYASVAAIDAWRDAGFIIPDTEDERVDWDTGAIIGSGIVGIDTIAEKLIPTVSKGKVRRLGSVIVEQVMNSGAGARIAEILALGNKVTSNSSACSTGTEAIIDAMWRIRTGLAKRMLAGGAEGSSPYIWAGFDSMRVITRKGNDSPEEASRPMSATASGFVPGAGAGVLMLEDLQSARQRGVRIYAEILGGTVNCGGHRSGGSMTAPNPKAVQDCIRNTISDAKITAKEIDAISGHLTATFADPVEIINWSRALGRGHEDFPYVNSTKSMIGHCLGATGAIESVAVILQLNKGFLHPSINCEDVHPEIAPFAEKIPHSLMEYPELKTIIKACFGFGDVNSCLIFRKWEE